MNKKILITTITITFILTIFGLYIYTHPSDFPLGSRVIEHTNPKDNSHNITPPAGNNFICSHPNYDLIENGQNKSTIIELIGQPYIEVIKPNIYEYRFGQGDMEKEIKEGWIYSFDGWDGGMEIYFNKYEIVIGKNCGHG